MVTFLSRKVTRVSLASPINCNLSIQKMHPFFSFHWERREGVQVKVGIFHSDAADLSAFVGGEIINQSLAIHTGGIDRAELSFVGSEKPCGLADGAQNVKKS